MAVYSKKVIHNFFAKADAATTKNVKGKALEDLVCYLFEKIPGMSITQRNVKNAFETEEIDVAFFNEQHTAGLKFLSNILLVECKNWSGAVGSIEVQWFASKIENRSLDFGILVAANGITGSAEDGKQAHDIASKSLMKGIRLVVVTRQEIENLKTSKDLVTLIKTKVCQLIVSGTVWP
jgi:hypothetical protein